MLGCPTVACVVNAVGCWAGRRWVSLLRAVRRDMTVLQRCLAHRYVLRWQNQPRC